MQNSKIQHGAKKFFLPVYGKLRFPMAAAAALGLSSILGACGTVSDSQSPDLEEESSAVRSLVSVNVSANIAPQSVVAGDKVAISVALTSTRSTTVDVQVEVKDPSGGSVFSTTHAKQQMTKNVAIQLADSFTIDPSSAEGNYALYVMVRNSGSSRVYYENSNVAQFAVTKTSSNTNPAVPNLGRVGLATYLIGNYSFEVDGTELGRRYDLVMLQEVHDLAPTAKAIKKANPQAITLAYMNINARDYAAAVSISELKNNGWELTPGDCSGGDWLFSGLCAADLSKPGYKERWADNAIKMLNDNGGPAVWSGVFIDDIRTVPSDPKTLFSGFSSTREWMDRALLPFMSYVHQRLATAGYVEGANMDGSWGQKREFTDEVIPYVRFPLDEFFASWPNDGCTNHQYYEDSWLSYDRAAAAGFAPISGNLTCNGSRTKAEYELALAMMATDGHLYVSLMPDNSYTRSTWFEDLMQNAKALGRPTGARTKSGSTWRRNYEHGYVEANPGAGTGKVVKQ